MSNKDISEKEITGAQHNITIVYADNSREEYALSSFGKAAVTFGRSEDCDIVIDSPIISRHHGRFEIIGDKCYICDDSSTNGIYLNGELTAFGELDDYSDIRIDDPDEPCFCGISIAYYAHNDGTGWVDYPLGEGETRIGRGEECEIRINHVTLALVQARIRNTQEGYVLIPESGSRTSVTLNGTPVTSPVLLYDRDLICIANTKLMFDNDEGLLSYKTESRGLELVAKNIARYVRAKGKNKYILDDTSLKIKPCEFVAIVGGSGSGKSTLMNCLNGFDKPSTGSVLVNGVDLYDNYEVLQSVIGYVPQQDIVHENLTLYEMLMYVAQLRMSPDSTKEEYASRVAEVIEMVELTGHENTLIRKMSGGQKKRASIAVELVDDPSLFFLDEPSSGLDPGTERSLMLLLQKMSRRGKTIVAITHTTQNLHLCDKMIFLGSGGYMAYFGPPKGALEFFGVNDLAEAYLKVEKDPQGWEIRFNNSKQAKVAEVTQTTVKREYSNAKKPFGKQTLVMAKRYVNLLWHDKIRLAFLLLQGPLIALLLSLVAGDNVFEMTFLSQQMLFCLSCAAVWVGLMNSIQEICKERGILRREYMSDMRLDSYIASKLLVQSGLCFIQSLLTVTVFALVVGMPIGGAIGNAPFIEILITIFFVMVSSSALGMLVSSIAKNPDRAMVFAPILLIPQLLFSGILFTLEGATNIISWFCASRWSMQALGNIADCNKLLDAYYRRILSTQYSGQQLENMVEQYIVPMYEHSPWNLILTWLVLIFTIAVLAGICLLTLRSVKNDKR